MKPAEVRRARVLSLVRQYGWNPSSFQILDAGYRYWFTRDAVVAYVDTGQALVVAGEPICADARLSEVSQRFVRAAGKRGRRVSFFGVHERLTRRVPWPSLHIGELPYWDPLRWADTVASRSGLRKQLRRTRAGGVRVRPAGVLSDGETQALSQLRQRWLGQHGMAAMSFLVGPPDFRSGQGMWLAHHRDRLVGYLCTSPIYQREGVLLGDLVRDPSAPNGTSELLVDAALRDAAASRVRYATLGLAPLAGPVPMWLQIARKLGRPLYDFEGVQAFKAKLRPQGSESMRLIAAGGGVELATLDALTAFAGGSLTAFLASTLRKRWRTAA